MPYRHESQGMGYFNAFMAIQFILIVLYGLWAYAQKGT